MVFANTSGCFVSTKTPVFLSQIIFTTPGTLELIIGNPGETLDSWKDGITKILEAGQHNSITIWNCQVLKNSEMNQPEYIEKYGIEKNKGYGTKQHLDGIKEHGISKWHRKTYGICKQY